jgi:hypothetical protein
LSKKLKIENKRVDEEKGGEVPLFDPFNCRSFGLEKGAPIEESVIEVSLHCSLTICFLGLGFERGWIRKERN